MMDDGVSSFNKVFRCFRGVLTTPQNNCVKSFRIRSYSGPYFPDLEQNKSEYRHFSRSECLSSFQNKNERFSLNQLISKMISWDAPIFRFQSKHAWNHATRVKQGYSVL